MARKQLPGFITYLTNEKSIEMLSDAELGQIFRGLFKVARREIDHTTEVIEPETMAARILFYSMAEQVRQNAEEWKEKADINQQNAQKPRKKGENSVNSESSDR